MYTKIRNLYHDAGTGIAEMGPAAGVLPKSKLETILTGEETERTAARVVAESLAQPEIAPRAYDQSQGEA